MNSQTYTNTAPAELHMKSAGAKFFLVQLSLLNDNLRGLHIRAIGSLDEINT